MQHFLFHYHPKVKLITLINKDLGCKSLSDILLLNVTLIRDSFENKAFLITD